VQVRVMADGLGGRKAPKERIEELCAAGGKWCWFHPPRFGQLTYFHKRNHRRAIIIDGEVGFTGGAAVADKWLGNAQDAEHWRDAMVEVRGPMASNLQPAFVQLWSHITGELLVGPDFYPPEHANLGLQTRELDEVLQHVDILSSPSTDDYPLRRVFWLSFRCARESIYITNPYFVPDQVARDVLKERARAGVDVRALVPNENNDVALIRWASHSYYQELLEAGIRLYEYQPTMIHQKHLVVDGEWCVVGSANMDVRSKELNQECVLGILDRDFSATIQKTFFHDLERAREITLDEWRRRPWYLTLVDRFFRIFEQQF
jgi:cardiolipin synthase